MTVLRFPGHKWFHCPRECEGCMFCNGGLGLCVTCGGAEGSLPTECPGEQMTSRAQDEVYNGRLDFRGGQWTSSSSDCAPPRRRPC